MFYSALVSERQLLIEQHRPLTLPRFTVQVSARQRDAAFWVMLIGIAVLAGLILVVSASIGLTGSRVIRVAPPCPASRSSQTAARRMPPAIIASRRNR